MKSVKFKHLKRHEVAEKNTLPSMTEPQQVLPLKQILDHRSRGIPIPIFNGVFSDQDTPDIQKLDFVEIAQLRDDTAQGIEQAKEDFHALTVQMEALKTPPPTPPKEEKPSDDGKQ